MLRHGPRGCSFLLGAVPHDNIWSHKFITPISPFTKFPRSIVLDKESSIKIKVAKNQNYSIQFDGIESISRISNEDEYYEYLLSEENLDVFYEKDIPKLDLFLNQILR